MSALKARRLLIVDRAFTEFEGHHRSANELVAAVAARNGYEPVVLASRRARIEALDGGAPVRPVFAGSPYVAAAETDADRLAELNRAAREDFGQVPQALLGPDTALYVHTTNENEVYGLARWLADAAVRRGIRGVLSVMLPPGVEVDGEDVRVLEPQKAAVYRRALQVLEAVRSNVAVTGISQSIAGQVAALAGRPVATAPALIEGVGRPLPPPRAPGAPPRILLYAGDIKIDKGFHLLPQIVRALGQTALRFEAHIQISGTMVERYAGLVEALEREAEGDGRFVLHRGRLSPQDYAALWHKDLAVMAYSPQKYRHQTSGVCWEAMNAAVPSVVIAGTWHEREMTAMGFCPVTVDSYWPASIVEGIMTALGRLDALAASWRAQQGVFAERNRPERFLEPLAALGGSGGGPDPGVDAEVIARLDF